MESTMKMVDQAHRRIVVRAKLSCFISFFIWRIQYRMDASHIVVPLIGEYH